MLKQCMACCVVPFVAALFLGGCDSQEAENPASKQLSQENVGDAPTGTISCLDITAMCPANHSCIDGVCVKDADAPELVCGQAESAKCPEGEQCFVGMRTGCVNSAFFKEPCASGCGVGEVCFKGKCTPRNSCEIMPCLADFEVCYQDECKAEYELPDFPDEWRDSCLGGRFACDMMSRCVRGPHIPQCLDIELFETPCDPACVRGELCFKGKCVPETSCEMIACDEGEVCEDHVCK